MKANAGSAGIDRQSLTDFEKNLKDNLYKIWNRLSSGSYFPPPVIGVLIPKKSGGTRTLGISTVSDRIAQMVVKLSFEPKVEPQFLADSYGYRPNKSALDAVGVTRKRCWKYDLLLEFDIKRLFDNIPHDLLMKAVEKHTQEKWITLYIKRWLTALNQLAQIFKQCGLDLHPDKTKVVYCKDSNRKGKYSVTSLDFLGYTFQPRLVISRDSKMFVSFTPAVSSSASKAMRDKIRQWKLKHRVELSLEEIAVYCNPVLRGWMKYYGKYSPSSFEPVWTQFNAVLVKWGMRKYKKLRGKTRSAKMLESIQQKQPTLFPHWRIGVGKSFA